MSELPFVTAAYVTFEGKQLAFTADNHRSQFFTFEGIEGCPIFNYSGYIQFQEAQPLNLKYSTQKHVLLLSPTMKARQVVILNAGGIDFQILKIQEVQVTLRHVDTVSKIKTERTYKFSKSNQHDYFEYEYRNDSAAYEWQISAAVAGSSELQDIVYFPGATAKTGK